MEGYNLLLKIPKFDELDYRRRLLADNETMAYNIGFGDTQGSGCINFNEKLWEGWFSRWVSNVPERYYAYVIRADDNIPVGEVALRYVNEKNAYCVNIIIEAKFRGCGFSKQALKLLLDVAFNELGAVRVFDEFPKTRISAEKAFKQLGFKRVTDNIVELNRQDYLQLFNG